MQQIIVDFGSFELFGSQVPLRIFGYGLSLVLGFLAGVYLAQWRARRAGENPEQAAYCGLLALIGGIFGARLAYVIEHYRDFFPEYGNVSDGLAEMLNITSGGLIYYGGVVLATVIVLAFLRIKHLPARRFLDIIAPGLMVGLAFGRLGCLLNGCCYGAPARPDWPLATRFPMYSEPLIKLDGRQNPYSASTEGASPPYAKQMEPEAKTGRSLITPDPRLTDESGRLIPPRDLTGQQIAIAREAHSHPVKPAQVLGLINAVVLAAILIAFGRLRKIEGQVFALLVILYPVTRFLLEIVRADNRHNVARGVLTHNQYTSIFLVIAGIVFWLVLHRLRASAGPTLAQRAAAGEVSGGLAQGTSKGKRKERN
jgi:phosphatidylglycerol:prolipoprotein diacylglycerol transferase